MKTERIFSLENFDWKKGLRAAGSFANQPMGTLGRTCGARGRCARSAPPPRSVPPTVYPSLAPRRILSIFLFPLIRFLKEKFHGYTLASAGDYHNVPLVAACRRYRACHLRRMDFRPTFARPPQPPPRPRRARLSSFIYLRRVCVVPIFTRENKRIARRRCPEACPPSPSPPLRSHQGEKESDGGGHRKG